ncbi:MAG: hypothetical protein KKG95_01825, partial [Candidatus Omnitrophica bacterium]|nr:hypothetical protein [Candidatus Omnitrophota bacterium]
HKSNLSSSFFSLGTTLGFQIFISANPDRSGLLDIEDFENTTKHMKSGSSIPKKSGTGTINCCRRN